ncbi:conserved hypothetical protein [Uncinocarpus reesii 1704]|uniref:NECAP PHear domain-containing protein n=1 Tax=Uncinocarpus reesii (strain UAMH 1704) TaxID=336963 RepID=C4JRU2_UNCRE|nr:uncharacterized protein UREG_05181 [Uncinocarpus reesii 1704]EEP80339.1 conserved hypothetical protein [Uncinocarpus reesii 1704]
MSSIVDPATGRPLPADAIQRVLYICHPVHVYAIPPLMSMKGYTAANWTVPDPRNDGKTKEIFTARLRILETAIPVPANPRTRPGRPAEETQEQVKTDILLEDSSTGDLFAAAPYTDAGVVEHAIDSSRFFAVRAMLGIGFEDRSEAFDFGVALQEARKVLGLEKAGGEVGADAKRAPMSSSQAGAGRRPGMAPARGRVGAPPGIRQQGQQQQSQGLQQKPADTRPKDYSLKPGQTITVNIGGRQRAPNPQATDASSQENQKALFSIPPPPGAASSADGGASEHDSPQNTFFLPPPPSTRDTRTDRRRRAPSALESKTTEEAKQKLDSAGFEDDDFGDFQ